MKKSKVNIARLQLKKQEIVGLAKTENVIGGIPPSQRGRTCLLTQISYCDVCDTIIPCTSYPCNDTTTGTGTSG